MINTLNFNLILSINIIYGVILIVRNEMGQLHLLTLVLCILSATCQLKDEKTEDVLQKNITQLRMLLEEIKETQAQNDDVLRKKVAALSEMIQKMKPKQNERESTTSELNFLLKEIKEAQDKNKRTLEEQLSKHLDEFRKLNAVVVRSTSQNQISTPQLGKLLNRAIKNGDEHQIFQLLLHVSVEYEDENKNRPIHLAVEHFRPEILEMLLEFGANIDSLGQYKRTALHWAGRNDCLECGNILLAKGANVHLRDIFQNTALHHPAIIGYIPFIEMLLENGADVNAVQQDNKTALHLACEKRQLGSVMTLLRYDADEGVRDRYGYTPLDIAVEKGFFDIVHYLNRITFK